MSRDEERVLRAQLAEKSEEVQRLSAELEAALRELRGAQALLANLERRDA